MNGLLDPSQAQGQPSQPMQQPMQEPMQQAQGLLPSQGGALPPQPQQATQQGGLPDERPKRDIKADPLNNKDRDLFDLSMSMALKLMHNKESRNEMINMINNEDNPERAVARAASAVFKQVQLSLGKKKMPPDRSVQILTAASITKEMSDLAQAAGLIEKPSPEKMQIMVAETIKSASSKRGVQKGADSIRNAVMDQLPEGDREAARGKLQQLAEQASLKEGNAATPSPQNAMNPASTMVDTLRMKKEQTNG